MRTYAVLSSLTNAITAAIIGTLIYRKSRGSPLHITYVFACASVVLWGLGYFFWQLSIHAEQALLYCRLLMVGAIFIPIFFFHHILILLDQKKPTLLKICYLSGFAFLIADFTPWFVAGVRSKRVFPFWPVAGPFFAPFLASFVAIAFYKLWLIYKALVGSSGNRRSRSWLSSPPL